MMTSTRRKTLSLVEAARTLMRGAVAVLAVSVTLLPDHAAAAEPKRVPQADTRRGPVLDDRARIEQDIRRNYNNYNRNLPTSPTTPRIRERHLRDGMLAPSGAASATCAYEYGRWQRSGSSYRRNRYLDCAG